MESINDRGIGVDIKFARKADRLAGTAKIRAGNELREITDGACHHRRPGQAADQLAAAPAAGLEGINMLTKREEEEADDGTITGRPSTA